MNDGGVEVSPARTEEDVAIVRCLFGEYAESLGVDLEYQGFSRELAGLPAPYVPPRGALLLARAGEQAVGCVALRPLSDGVVEMKRLYVRPAFRSVGVGRELVNSALNAAAQAGYKELRLDTLPSMVSARKLYRELGFLPSGPYGDSYLPETQFFSISLAV
jgi:putative acetyltransferase